MENVEGAGTRESLFDEHPFAGLRISATTPRAATAAIVTAAGQRRSGAIHLVNAYTVALADKDRALKDLLRQGVANLPDGKPLSWAAKLRGAELGQVRGPDLFQDVLRAGCPTGLRHYLLGGTPETLELLRRKIGELFPEALVVGAESPPFRPPTVEELSAQDQRITASGAQIVWIGLGTPKQDIEARRLADAVPILTVAVGAAFDFLAGTKRQAPSWMRQIGLEWLFRFASEPRRLWRRYVFGNARFIKVTLLESGA
jgi:N-acetylglucosaminyldiphosphoundecaprenol N-acetyl-beta-D-mannosaminyltransferase